MFWCISFKCFLWQNFTYWDDWLRLKENHKGRQFIRPEVCRTYNFGEHVRISIWVIRIFIVQQHPNCRLTSWCQHELAYILRESCRDILVYVFLCSMDQYASASSLLLILKKRKKKLHQQLQIIIVVLLSLELRIYVQELLLNIKLVCQ